jgi:hypothetical protein
VALSKKKAHEKFIAGFSPVSVNCKFLSKLKTDLSGFKVERRVMERGLGGVEGQADIAARLEIFHADQLLSAISES